jgi:hypothetical protein
VIIIHLVIISQAATPDAAGGHRSLPIRNGTLFVF